MISGYAIATLVVFIISIIFVIHPVSIPRWRLIPSIPFNLTTAPILAIALLWAAQCLNPPVIRDGIVGTDGVKPYNILILFFSLAYMAITLDVTGILKAAAYWVSNKGGSNGWKLYFYFYIMLTFLSVLLGNDPVILSGTAFLVYYTKVANLEPMPWLISEFAAANTASMVLFVGNPTNVVICEGFGVNNAAFTAYTILPFITCNVVCFLALATQFHSRKHIPRKLAHSEVLNAREQLLDPVGACVGSIMLGSTLVLCLVVSFFGIDVWMISLPFAVGKLIFDFAWDHYRFTRKSRALQSRSTFDSKSPLDSKHTEYEDSENPTSEPTGAAQDGLSGSTLIEKGTAVLPPTRPPTPQPSSSDKLMERLQKHFPTFFTALPRLPFALVPFAFSQFILIEALAHQGWIEVFARWLQRASQGGQMHPTIWIIGVLGVILCNLSGTNIGATILLTQVARAADLPAPTFRAAAIALAIASNIGAVSFTFSASLAGLLWKTILGQKGVHVKQREFAFWNLLPLLVMTIAGLGIVSAEMAVLY
ncbi:hypothetical protein BJ138DRAFT_660414 [Hygrophoropsis aurantiaca]|uniref:Uncharacterized protein n=1 Tax=Hygrophoropsis aurantiaca TaxID=72124 RepID=A0ACB7ZYL1_9AGAM|nr:hypothetical protein BJ138DRAFT_660414 [Hygrophoropsis aurantiaca]